MNLFTRSVAEGVRLAARHYRLSVLLWITLFVSSSLALRPLSGLVRAVDGSPFGERLLAGWDGDAFVGMLAGIQEGLGPAFAAIPAGILLFALLSLVLSTGILRTLQQGLVQGSMRRAVIEGVALFPKTFGAFFRFGVGTAAWLLLVAGLPAWILYELPGKDAPPNNGFTNAAILWGVLAALAVFLVRRARFDVARALLAQNAASTGRGASRLAGRRVAGARVAAAAIVLFWLIVVAILQTVFTRLGVAMNPQTNAGTTGLVVVRQIGFLLVAFAHVAQLGSLSAFERLRRPVPTPLPRLASPG
ncbi:MAG: hypothetical protein JNK60_13765 [Acidobacteria bacterium]|nr:hypothetical protein [Acidobacteriota bacterium]